MKVTPTLCIISESDIVALAFGINRIRDEFTIYIYVRFVDSQFEVDMTEVTPEFIQYLGKNGYSEKVLGEMRK